MDDHLNALLQQLGTALKETLADSDRIVDAIAEIKQSGYDVLIVLEATIGFHKRSENPYESVSNFGQGQNKKPVQSETTFRSADGRPVLNLTPQDTAFCKALKITIEEDPK